MWVGSAAALVVALAAGSAVYASQESALEAQDAALAAQSRVDQSVLAASRDVALDQGAELAVANAAYLSGRARTEAQAKAVIDQANATLAATPERR